MRERAEFSRREKTHRRRLCWRTSRGYGERYCSLVLEIAGEVSARWESERNEEQSRLSSRSGDAVFSISARLNGALRQTCTTRSHICLAHCRALSQDCPMLRRETRDEKSSRSIVRPGNASSELTLMRTLLHAFARTGMTRCLLIRRYIMLSVLLFFQLRIRVACARDKS